MNWSLLVYETISLFVKALGSRWFPIKEIKKITTTQV